MESLPRLQETEAVEDRLNGYKLVPWLSWDQWDNVRESLFSSSPDCVASALNTISGWRSRGCLPVVIEITASLIEIQHKDPFFRLCPSSDALRSDEMLAMLYCMAIMRLVNGVLEKTRKKHEVSIAEAADAIGIPRMLIDIRHEGSHRDLPSIRLARLSSIKALEWLEAYYWEPQKKAVTLNNGSKNIRKEIESRLHELAFLLKAKRTSCLSSSEGKFRSSKKQITKTLKNLVRLYTSFSSEVIYVLLDLLLKASDSVKVSLDRGQTVFNEWKRVMTKFSNKEPDVLLSLLKAVLERIETEGAVKYEAGEQHLTSLEVTAASFQIECLSSLFSWLLGIVRAKINPPNSKISAPETDDKSSATHQWRSHLREVLRKCLLISAHGNNQLVGTAHILAQMIGNRLFIEKINKLSSLCSSNSGFSEENICPVNSESYFMQQEGSIHQAAEKLEFLKIHVMQRKKSATKSSSITEHKSKWVVAKSWNPCPIGMLPRDVGSSGCVPLLDCHDCHKEVVELSEKSEEKLELDFGRGKRVASCDVEVLDNSTVKKMRESDEGCVSDPEEIIPFLGVEGRLMIGEIMKKVGEEELHAIISNLGVLA